MNGDVVLFVMVIAALVISLYTGFRLFLLLERTRRESSRSFEIALRMQEDWERFTEKEKENRRRFTERFERFEEDVRDRVDRFEKVAAGTRERLIKLEQYLKEFFEVELKAVFNSFDKTVASILEEMKAELLRGVERIEDIQAVVDSKSYAQDRILDGEGSVYRMIADTGEEAGHAVEAPPAKEPPTPAPEPSRPSAGTAPDAPNLRLEADEAE